MEIINSSSVLLFLLVGLVVGASDGASLGDGEGRVGRVGATVDTTVGPTVVCLVEGPTGVGGLTVGLLVVVRDRLPVAISSNISWIKSPKSRSSNQKD